MMEEFAAVAVGGAFGAIVRASLIHGIASLAAGGVRRRIRFEPLFATIVPNALGCLILGLYFHFPTLPQESAGPQWPDLLLTAGFCGGLTTFSTLCSDASRLRCGRGHRPALVYLALTLATGFIAFNLAALPLP